MTSLASVYLTRRSLLIAAALGLSASGCGLIGGDDEIGLPATDEVTEALRSLAKEAGGETFQRVEVHTRGSYKSLAAELLTTDGGVQRYTFDERWEKDTFKEKSILIPPVSAKIEDLPLARLGAYTGAAGPGVETIAFAVDYVGRIRVDAYARSEWVGLKDDASGTVPDLNPDDAAGVRAAVAEIVAGYGAGAAVVGSFNGFVHVDGNVEGSRAGVRIIRRPRLGVRATVTQETPYDATNLFDPGGFDPTMALTRKATIAVDAGVEGKVWDWEYQRPPQGGEPLVSFGIGPNSPTTRVWLDRNGKIAATVTGKCKDNSGWCPK